MKSVKVQYTVQQEYVQQNKERIQKVMDDLQQLNNPGIKYQTFILADNKSFVHFMMAASEEANNVLTNLDSFKLFQSELKASLPEVSPKVEQLSLVGSSYTLFDLQ